MIWDDFLLLRHSSIFDGKLSHSQKIKFSRALKTGRIFFHPNLTKLGYPLGVYVRTKHAKNFWNRTRGSGDMGVQRVWNDSAACMRQKRGKIQLCKAVAFWIHSWHAAWWSNTVNLIDTPRYIYENVFLAIDFKFGRTLSIAKIWKTIALLFQSINFDHDWPPVCKGLKVYQLSMCPSKLATQTSQE